MKRSLFSFFLTTITVVAICVCTCVPAYADSDKSTYTLTKGETVYGLCQAAGIDYYDQLPLILKLNGFTKESQLGRLAVGTEIVLPTGAGSTPELISGDSVAYYLMPFLFNEGDTICKVYNLWGMNYENYADVIRSVNDKKNLDYIWVGELLYLPTNSENLMGKDYTTVIFHCMKVGETAYDVCASYGMEYDKIEDELAEYNPNVKLTKLKAGETLYVPML